MFGKGAGSLPTASSILSDVMARRHDYKYEYKKMDYLDRPAYSTDVALRVYLRYSDPSVVEALGFDNIDTRYFSRDHSYVIGEITLRRLIEARSLITRPDIFLCNIPRFFLDRD